MTLISATFVCFLGLTLLAYYLLPKTKQWYALLVGSLVFYASCGVRNLLFVLAASVVGYLTARKISRLYETPACGDGKSAATKTVDVKASDGKPAEGESAGGEPADGKPAHVKAADVKGQARRVLTAGLAVVIAMLVLSKTGSLWSGALAALSKGKISLQVLVPLGISYYTFALAGYMADVYWRKDTAEKNYLKLLTYLIYFPHITQGPIPRHKRLSADLFEEHSFDYTRLCFGLQRMVWGFFKKAVAADRLALLTGTVFAGDQVYPGSISLLAVICSAFQLYFDFSGCMDIVIGVSECFGITLDENFTRPFFAQSAAEFWRRWHITLGTWFKDYVYLPVSISTPVTKLARHVKERHGRKAARNVSTVIALAVVWLLTGLWHGTGPDYILWGCYWGTIIICSTVFAKEIAGLTGKLPVDPKGRAWKTWRIVRTFLIYCGGRLLTAPGSLAASGRIIRSFFTSFQAGALADGSLLNLGIDAANMIVLGVAFVLIAAADILNEKGICIRERVARLPLPVRWLLYYMLIMAVVIFGKYGAAYDKSAFIYAGF